MSWFFESSVPEIGICPTRDSHVYIPTLGQSPFSFCANNNRHYALFKPAVKIRVALPHAVTAHFDERNAPALTSPLCQCFDREASNLGDLTGSEQKDATGYRPDCFWKRRHDERGPYESMLHVDFLCNFGLPVVNVFL